MRSLILISALAFAAADNEGVKMEQEAGCALDGAESVSDAMDASMFIWASIARCGKTGEMVKCEIAVSSAIASLDKMTMLILKATDSCGALNTVNKECGMQMAALTNKMAGISASSGAVVQKCGQGDGPHGLNWNQKSDIMCMINIKDTAVKFFKIVKSFLVLEKTGPCKSGDKEACAAAALQIIGAFSSMGEFIAGAVGTCSLGGAKYVGAACASQSQHLVSELTTFAERAIDVSKACGPQPAPPATTTLPPGVQPEAAERLYSNEGKMAVPAASSPTNLILAAFLPVTAIVGFVGGRMYGSGRAARATREFAPMSSAE